MDARSDAWTDAMLAVLAADEPPLAADELRHRVLLAPAFHPVTLLSARLGRAPELRLAGLLGPAVDDEPAPYFDDAAAPSPAQADELRRALDACEPRLGDPDDRLGLDGVTLVFEVARGSAAPRRFAAWSPEHGDPRHTHVAALYHLAGALLRAPEAQQRLAQLHGYLRLDAPVRDLGGAPRRLRIFGRLSSSDLDALAGLFGAVAPDEPVLVDMLDFEGMGTLCYPPFRRFARRPGPLAWAASKRAYMQLREARVPTGQLFESLAGALRRLGAG
jgi:hypothetical protein